MSDERKTIGVRGTTPHFVISDEAFSSDAEITITSWDGSEVARFPRGSVRIDGMRFSTSTDMVMPPGPYDPSGPEIIVGDRGRGKSRWLLEWVIEKPGRVIVATTVRRVRALQMDLEAYYVLPYPTDEDWDVRHLVVLAADIENSRVRIGDYKEVAFDDVQDYLTMKLGRPVSALTISTSFPLVDLNESAEEEDEDPEP